MRHRMLLLAEMNGTKKLIADKIRGRLSSGPSKNRRTFQFFDRDGSGAIDLDEFVDGLKKYFFHSGIPGV